MNLLIGLAVVLLVAHGISGYSATVEQRQAESAEGTAPRDEYQRSECETWRGWPKHYHPWFCEQQ